MVIFCGELAIVRHHAERKKYFMTFTKYCPFLIYNYNSLLTKKGWWVSVIFLTSCFYFSDSDTPWLGLALGNSGLGLVLELGSCRTCYKSAL